jgi:8-oxo-dGTP pyrophosphatase MutT (NUDIX family)
MREIMKDRLKRTLYKREKIPVDDDSLVTAAVLIPLFYKDDEYWLLFTKRTQHLRDHKGQISFPGGRWEDHDATLLNTALRECSEEIGLPSDKVEVLGELDDMVTMYTNYLVTPYVGFFAWPLDLKIDPFEVDEIITVPVSALLSEDALRQEDDPVNRGISEGYFYYYDDRIIWGATARILTQFLEIWTEAVNGNPGK